MSSGKQYEIPSVKKKPPTVSKAQKFVKDLGIYAIGNLGSKFITFILVPFYTYFITDPAEFGYYDICLTIVFCLGPIISMQLSEGGFRSLLEEKEEDKSSLAMKRSVVTFVYVNVLRNAGILLLLSLVIGPWSDLRFWLYVVTYGVILSIYDVTNQLVRGLGFVAVFMQVNICNSLAIAIFSVLFVGVLGWGVPGIFLANIGARLFSMVWINIRLQLIKRYFLLKSLDKVVGGELLRYSLPLLPMILIWWVLNYNNVFFINHFLGFEANGIYAMLGKFTGILFILANIFYQTWQQNAIEQFNTESRDKVFNTVFNNYIYVLCLLVSVFPFAIRLNFGWLVSADYYHSVDYMFLNSLFVMGVSIASFYEVQYQCAKKTARILPSIIIGLAVNITCNYFLIQFMGLYGIVISSILTYVAVIVYRAIDTREIVTLHPDRRLWIYALITAGAGGAYSLTQGLISDCVALLTLGAIFVLIAPKTLKETVRNLKRNIIWRPKDR